MTKQPVGGQRPLSPGRADSTISLRTALFLISGFMLVEVIGGILANSLALLADAAHMVTDAAALALALLAILVAGRPPSSRRTFGFHRTEVLAALANVLFLWAVSGWIFYEAYQRFQNPPEVQGPIMMSVGIAGLLVNVAAAWVLRRSAGHNLNVRGAYLHVLGDLLGSIGVVVGGILVITLGWTLADPIFGAVIGLLVLFSSTRLLWDVVHVLMQGTPSQLNLDRLCGRLEHLEGVTGVHDLHVWSLTSGYDVLSAHVTTSTSSLEQRQHVLEHLREVAAVEFNISHVTIQLETSSQGCDETHHVSHPMSA
ncbi:MAG: cation diffusion facilitator family transporter [Chloroflexi bacterium]|nr:cation diffusion facilitator family transporter [Chloroflexota bacterium]